MSDLMQIEVGGRRYQSNVDTLSGAGYFRKLLLEGETFVKINRDPQFFGPLLVYLRKGRLSVNPSKMDAGEKYQLFSDILFYDIGDLMYLIEADIAREKDLTQDDIHRMAAERQVRLDALRKLKSDETDLAKVQVLASGGLPPDTKPAAAPTVEANGAGCFYCGTIAHSEASCKHNPENKAG